MKSGIWAVAVAVTLVFSTKAVFATDDRELGKPTEQDAPAKVTPADTTDNDVTYGPKDDGEADISDDGWATPMNERELKAYHQTPIYPQFDKAFKKCAPAGCEPLGLKTLFKTGVKNSCLLQGKSLNLGSIQCTEGKDTKVYKAIDGGKFEQIIKCMQKNKDFFIKYKTGMDKVRGYRSFALVSLGCNFKNGRPTQY